MTLGGVIKSVYEELGEPSDLNPATVGIPKLRNAVNDAQDVIAQWIDDRGRKVYFREMDAQIGFETVVKTGTLGTQASQKIIVLPSAASPARYVDWVLTVGGESRKVLFSGVSGLFDELTVNKAFTGVLDGASYILSKVEYHFTGIDAIDTDGLRVAEILRIFDSDSETELEETATRDYLFGAGSGVPRQWRHKGSGLLFDVAPNEVRHYVLHVKRLPTKLEDQTDLIDLPEAFIQPLVLRTVWWGYRRMQDFQAAYATKKEFQELMTRLATASWLSEGADYFTVRNR